MDLRRILLIGLGIIIVGFIALQFFPIGMVFSSMARETDLPPSQTIEWTSPEVAELVRTSCYDCHSNEVVYPWYSHVAPVSWLINYDVNNGRASLNFSEDDFSEFYSDDLLWHLETDMPPQAYLLLHPEARLSDEQIDTMYNGLVNTLDLQMNPEEMDMD